MDWVHFRIGVTKVPVKDNLKFAFASSFVIGILVHFSVLSNNLLNHDGAGAFYWPHSFVDHGRWLLKSVCSISTYFTIPWVTGILSILYLSIAITIIVEIFSIQQKVSILITASFLMTFPALSSTFSYLYVADGYMLGVACACLSVLFVQKLKHGYLWGAIPLACSLGIYQAYLSISILLILLLLIIQILDSKSTVQQIFLKIKDYLLLGLFGAVIDFICMKAALLITNMNLTDYQGASSINQYSLSIDNILKSIEISIQEFFSFPQQSSISGYGFIKYILIAYAVIFILTVVLIIRKNKIYNNPIKIILLLLIFAFLPFALEIIRFVIPDVWYHMLMNYPWCILFISVPLLHELYINNAKEMYIGKGYCLLTNLAVICAVIIIFVYFLITNLAYFNMENRVNKVYGMTVRMVDRIEQVDGFTFETPVLFYGDTRYSTESQADEYLEGLIGTTNNDFIISDIFYKVYIDNTLNLKFPTPDQQTIEKIRNNEQFRSMPLWPARDSVQMIEGVIVIKVNSNGDRWDHLS